MRSLSLIAAAICGAIGAVGVLNGGIGLLPPASGGAPPPVEMIAAELGIGAESTPQIPQQSAPPMASEIAAPGHDWAPSAHEPEHEASLREAARDRDIPARLASNTVARPVAVGSRTPSGWVVVATSGEGRPMHLKTIGSGSIRTLVIAGLDGEDRVAVNWIDQFVQQLHQTPDALKDYQLVLLRAANPDGLTAKHLQNGRGVALNRNFPTANFRPRGNPSAGIGPASEPETRAVMQLLYDLKPQRVVHLTSAASTSVAVCNGVAEEAASSLRDMSGLAVESFDPRLHGGSVEEFATTVLGIELVSLRLRIGENWRSAAVTHYPTFLAASIPLTHRGELAQTTRSKPKSTKGALDDDPISATSAAPVTRRNRSGYEELPPPPNKRGW